MPTREDVKIIEAGESSTSDILIPMYHIQKVLNLVIHFNTNRAEIKRLIEDFIQTHDPNPEVRTFVKDVHLAYYTCVGINVRESCPCMVIDLNVEELIAADIHFRWSGDPSLVELSYLLDGWFIAHGLNVRKTSGTEGAMYAEMNPAREFQGTGELLEDPLRISPGWLVYEI